MIQLKYIVKRYTDGDEVRCVLNHLSLEVDDGNFVAITGESGAGKTTLLSILSTLLQADEGTYLLNGTDIINTTGELPTLRNKHIGMVYQDHRLLPQFNAIQNILLPTLANHKSVPTVDMEYAKELMHFVGIDSLDDRPVDNLSGGEKARVAICRALINRPTLLLADEPTGQLDATNAQTIATLFQQVNAQFNTTIIMATHSSEMAKAAQNTFKLINGKLITA
jgi:ABC-type lipoprotein export system ATPase subunit